MAEEETSKLPEQTIKTSTLDYKRERDLSSIINCVIDEILKALARGTKPVTSKYSNTTAQQASCHQASHINSNTDHLLK